MSPAYLVLDVRNDLDSSYANFLFRDRKMVAQYLVCSKGVGSIQRNLYWPHLKRVIVAIPPTDEQVKIAKVVKWKTAQINKFIRNKRRLIELLKEQKQNVINQAVTRGLDPNVKFKPSGVEWIGDIPEHWMTCQLKRCLLRNDAGVWGSGFSGDGAIVFRSTEQTVDGHWRITDPAKRILTEAERKGATLKVGDLLITKSSGSPSHIGKTTLVTDEVAALNPCFSNFMQRLRPKTNVEPEFLWLYMNSRAARTQLQYFSNSTTGLGNLSESTIGKIIAFLPPKGEQSAILSNLKSEVAPIDAAIKKANSEIELMREYRTRLISDVVTGQVDVRGIEVPEDAEEELLALDADTSESDAMIDNGGDIDETD